MTRDNRFALLTPGAENGGPCPVCGWKDGDGAQDCFIRRIGAVTHQNSDAGAEATMTPAQVAVQAAHGDWFASAEARDAHIAHVAEERRTKGRFARIGPRKRSRVSGAVSRRKERAPWPRMNHTRDGCNVPGWTASNSGSRTPAAAGRRSSSARTISPAPTATPKCAFGNTVSTMTSAKKGTPAMKTKIARNVAEKAVEYHAEDHRADAGHRNDADLQEWLTYLLREVGGLEDERPVTVTVNEAGVIIEGDGEVMRAVRMYLL